MHGGLGLGRQLLGHRAARGVVMSISTASPVDPDVVDEAQGHDVEAQLGSHTPPSAPARLASAFGSQVGGGWLDHGAAPSPVRVVFDAAGHGVRWAGQGSS